MSNQSSSLRHSPLLIGTAIFVWLWVLARAWVQSLTIDEADTYLSAVWQPGASHWNPTANNHVLNSMLMRLFTTIFGVSTITMRIPALIGSALFIAAVYFLVSVITPRSLLRWSLMVCLTCSPFIMDYLVAARGYSLASAFLLGMIVLAARYQQQDPEARKAGLQRTCVWISICGALCFSANFSFAIADALTALGLYLWICRDHRREHLRILAAFTLPGLAVAYFLVGSIVRAWPKGQFTWGADSLLTMIKSLLSASLFEPNSYFLNPRIHHYFVHFGTFLYPLLLAFILWRLVVLWRAKGIGPLATICGLALIAALAVHEFLFLAFGILLPLDRTAMWVVLLLLVTAGALAAVPLPSRVGQISSRALSVILLLIACYNIGALRLTYFKEWQYDADMKHVYSVLSYYKHKYGATRVSANWRYVSALNCYRIMSGEETFDRLPGAPTVVDYYPPEYQVYVFYYPVDQDFYHREGLKLVYHDTFSHVAVAIRPEVEAGR